MGPKARGAIDLDQALELSLKAVAKALGKPLSRLTVITLAKPRHDKAIKEMPGPGSAGVRHSRRRRGRLHPHLSAGQRSGHALRHRWGAGRGDLPAAVIRALDGDMQAGLNPRHQVKGDSPEVWALKYRRSRAAEELGIDVSKVLKLEDLGQE